jgi:FAD/FMN-containing dehydrogenase
MTGSEGLLGVVVEITVRLLPLPERAQVLLAAYDDIGQAGAAVGAIIAAGIIPAGLEMMDNPAIRAAEAFVHAGYPTEAAAILLCELDGANEEVSQEILRVRQILLESGAVEVRTARDEAERLLFWKGRKAAFPAVGRLSPDYYCMDGTIPRRRLSEVLGRIAAMSAAYGLPVANVFHAGDGNLHPLILYDANVPGELERTEELGGKILELCVEVGGTITGEHGVGKEKIDQMCVQFQPQELAQFHAVKAAFDPAGLLNPAKAVPTLHRCAEFGAMHVHGGQLKFPELPTVLSDDESGSRACGGAGHDRRRNRVRPSGGPGGPWYRRGSPMQRIQGASNLAAGYPGWPAAHDTGRPAASSGRRQQDLAGARVAGEGLAVAGHRGILSYEPTELVITARAGTPLAEIKAALAERGQWLAFEPPHFDASPTPTTARALTRAATLGGTIACGLSGPARPYAGAARDSSWGSGSSTAAGEVLRFGGEVMKNVAGYDLSRLMVGAQGTLGVLLEVSLKVLPRPAMPS